MAVFSWNLSSGGRPTHVHLQMPKQALLLPAHLPELHPGSVTQIRSAVHILAARSLVPPWSNSAFFKWITWTLGFPWYFSSGKYCCSCVHHQYFLNRIAGSQQAFHQPVKGFSRFVGWNDHIHGFLADDHCTSCRPDNFIADVLNRGRRRRSARVRNIQA